MPSIASAAVSINTGVILLFFYSRMPFELIHRGEKYSLCKFIQMNSSTRVAGDATLSRTILLILKEERVFTPLLLKLGSLAAHINQSALPAPPSVLLAKPADSDCQFKMASPSQPERLTISGYSCSSLRHSESTAIERIQGVLAPCMQKKNSCQSLI